MLILLSKCLYLLDGIKVKYNVGGYWNYEGKNAISTKIDGSDKCDFSKVLYHNIDFDRLTELK